MRLPFHREIDAILRSNSSACAKVFICAVVTAVVALLGYFKETRRPGSTFSLSPPMLCVFAVGWATLGAVFGLILLYKDVLVRRAASGGRTGRLSKIYFESGSLSLLAWFVTIFFGVLLVTIVAVVARII